MRVNNTQTTHAGKVYTRDYVIDYTSFENDDLMVFAERNGQLEYEQKHVYAGSERIEQFTDKGNWERTLYVHEDVMGIPGITRRQMDRALRSWLMTRGGCRRARTSC